VRDRGPLTERLVKSVLIHREN